VFQLHSSGLNLKVFTIHVDVRSLNVQLLQNVGLCTLPINQMRHCAAGATARATQGAVRQAASQSRCQTKLRAQNHITVSDSSTSTEVTTELDTEADSHEGAASGIKSSSQVLATQATCATGLSESLLSKPDASSSFTCGLQVNILCADES
jgi:hypothetical protein